MKAASLSRVTTRRPLITGLIAAAVIAGATAPWWWPVVKPPAAPKAPAPAHAHDDHDQEHGEADGHDHGDEAAHEHDHAGHDEGSSIELSANALKNIGYQSTKIALGAYQRVITLPAIVIERPGRSQFEITAPLTGVVTRIIPSQGAGIEPGSAMFELRLTHEELVTAQRDFLQTAESLDVVNKEIQRLTAVGERIVAGKRVLEQEYEKQKLEGSLKAETQALLLHGLSEQQVADILKTRQLLQYVTVVAPKHVHDEAAGEQEHLYHVQQLAVKLGQQVEAGKVLCVLADHCQLLIEARAFEDDAASLREAARQGQMISAHLIGKGEPGGEVTGLKLLYLADSIDPETRALKAYLQLPNEVVLDQADGAGQRFIEWRFKPGQRMELQVPVETWSDRIVLPVEAVVIEGPEAFVYRRYGDHFDRQAVHVEHRDPSSTVIANDGSIKPGDVVATTGAYQIHLALKNKSGGGIDPHEGHTH